MNAEDVRTLWSALRQRRMRHPYPSDVFRPVPKTAWPKLNAFCQNELRFPIDRVSADLMRRGYCMGLQDAQATLVELAGPILTQEAFNTKRRKKKVS